MIPQDRTYATIEEFLHNTIPVKRILWGSVASPLSPDHEHPEPVYGPVALLDLSQHPHIHITDLVRVYQTDMPGAEGATEYAWDFSLFPLDQALARLTLAYAEPVALTFSILFHVGEHWTFLRWVAEHEGWMPLADEADGPIPEGSNEIPPSRLYVQLGGAQELIMFLQAVKIGEAKERKGKLPTGLEVLMASLEGKRFRSIAELATVFQTWMHIPHQGTETQLFYTFDTHKRIPLKGISRPFKLVLQQLAKQHTLSVALLDGVPHFVRRDWLQEKAQEETRQSEGERDLPHEPRDVFTAGALAVVRLAEAAYPDGETGSPVQRTIPVALLDLSLHPALNLPALAKQGVFERDAPTAYTWVVGQGAKDLMIRLTCTYHAPSEGHFAVLFHYPEHQTFLRWVCEHDTLVPLADERWWAQEGFEHPVICHATNPDLPGSVSLMLMHQVLTREGHVPDVPEMAKLLFGVKRYLALDDFAEFASRVFHIPVRGTEEQFIFNALGAEEEGLLVQQLSPDFRLLLLEVLALDGITSGLFQGKACLFTEDWLADQQAHPR